MDKFSRDNVARGERMWSDACRATYGLPIPVTRDGSGKMIKDYSLLDWADALDEERAEVMEAAVEYRQYLSWNNRKHLLEELADLKTVCTSWQSAIGADESERAEIQRAVNEKNRRRGYLV